MKKVKCLTAGLLLAFTISPVFQVQALSLGSIQVQSFLNQPLKAQLPLNAVDDITPSEINIALADHEVFEKAGIERSFYLTQLEFEIINVNGTPVVRVTSADPIQDPFISFIVEAKWGSGRVLREYTVLLDPAGSKVKQVQNTRHTALKTQSKSKKLLSRFTQKGETFAPVQADDTLWDIALHVSNQSGSDIHQSMMAIARKNPNAFIGGNINRLRKGAQLYLPNKDEIFSMSISEAMTQVHEHRMAWKKNQPAPSLSSFSQSEETKQDVLDVTESQEDEKPLKLVMPQQQNEPSQESTPNTSIAQPIDAETMTTSSREFQNRLLMIEEALDTLKRTNQSLKSDQEELLENNKSLMQILSKKDEEIQLLKEQIKTIETQKNIAQTQEDLLIEDVTKPQTSKVSLNANTQTGVEVPVVSQIPAPEKTVIENTSPPEPQKTKLDQVPQPNAPIPQAVPLEEESTSIWPFLLVFLVISGVSVMLIESMRRKGIIDFSLLEKLPFRKEDTEDEPLWTPNKETEEIESTDLESALQGSATKDEIDEAFAIFDEPEETTKKNMRKQKLSHPDQSLNSEKFSHLGDDQSVLSDVDVYIAYERYGNAEQILKQFLEKHPEEYEAHLKLLEVYHLSNQIDKLHEYFDKLPKDLPKRNISVWQQINELLKHVEQSQPKEGKSEPNAKVGQPEKTSKEVTLSFASSQEGTLPPAPSQEVTLNLASSQEGGGNPAPSQEVTMNPASSQEGTLKPTSSQEQDQVINQKLPTQSETKQEQGADLDLSSKSHIRPETPSFNLNKQYSLELSQQDPSHDKPEKELEDKTTEEPQTFEDPNPDYQYLGDQNEFDTKLALAQAYIDLGDVEGAKEHLNEVIEKGTVKQKEKAETLYIKLKEL